MLASYNTTSLYKYYLLMTRNRWNLVEVEDLKKRSNCKRFSVDNWSSNGFSYVIKKYGNKSCKIFWKLKNVDLRLLYKLSNLTIWCTRFRTYFKIKSNLAEAYVYCTNKMYLINVENLFYSKKINHHLTNNN